jgi:hypothetical protein
MLWSFSFFFYYLYVLIISCIVLYMIPSLSNLSLFVKQKNNVNFEYLTGFDLFWVFSTIVFFFVTVNFTWCSYPISAWFGNLFFAHFQNKISYFVIFFFYLIIIVYSTTFYFSSKQTYDFIIIIFNFFYWILFLFFTNNLFTFIFFIEILSTLIFVLLVNSTFSTTYFYNNLDLSLNSYFSSNTPMFYLQTLMYFFWISLITSLNLFFFLILFYIKFLTFDMYLFEFVFYNLITLQSFKDLFSILLIWFNFLFCIFLKCGLVPFYFWKPMFFKGIPLHSLFFYIFFFYFFLFLFIIYFILTLSTEIFFFFIFINIVTLLIGFLMLLFILCEAYYLKAFFALSSIINTLFVFLALNGSEISYSLFFL